MIFLRVLCCCIQVGFLHRDIKPSNFVIGPPSLDPEAPEVTEAGSSKLYLVDFGLCRYYLDRAGVDKDGEKKVLPARDKIDGFRYAMLTACMEGV